MLILTESQFFEKKGFRFTLSHSFVTDEETKIAKKVEIYFEKNTERANRITFQIGCFLISRHS